MNRNGIWILLGLIASAFAGWVTGRHCAFERIKRDYAKRLDEISEKIEKLERVSKKEHEIQDEKANLEYEREMLRLQNDQIRKRIINEAKADAIEELRKTHRKFPYM